MDIFALQALLCGVLTGFLICFTGVGGGILVVPILSFFFSLPVSAAVGTASAYAALTKVFAGVEHARIRNINYALAGKIFAGALPATAVAAVSVNALLVKATDGGEAIQEFLRVAVIVAIFIALSLSIFRVDRRIRYRSPFLAVAAGVFIGLIMGATGVGGGVLIVPALMLVGNETPKRIVGTAIVIALLLSGMTSLIYAGGGQLNYPLIFWMTLGSCLGIPLGSVLLRRVPQNFVHNSVVALIVLSLILMLF